MPLRLISCAAFKYDSIDMMNVLTKMQRIEGRFILISGQLVKLQKIPQCQLLRSYIALFTESGKIILDLVLGEHFPRDIHPPGRKGVDQLFTLLRETGPNEITERWIVNITNFLIGS